MPANQSRRNRRSASPLIFPPITSTAIRRRRYKLAPLRKPLSMKNLIALSDYTDTNGNTFVPSPLDRARMELDVANNAWKNFIGLRKQYSPKYWARRIQQLGRIVEQKVEALVAEQRKATIHLS